MYKVYEEVSNGFERGWKKLSKGDGLTSIWSLGTVVLPYTNNDNGFVGVRGYYGLGKGLNTPNLIGGWLSTLSHVSSTLLIVTVVLSVVIKKGPPTHNSVHQLQYS